MSVAQEIEPKASWPRALGVYAQPRLGRSLIDLGTSVAPYLALVAAMIVASHVSTLLTLALVLPTSGFLIRTFIVFHDCAHGSFLRSRRGNNLLGAAIGLLVWLPFRSWQHEHAVHHATAGNLDRRGVGDIFTLTVAEYRALPLWRRVGYVLFRAPVVMFGLGWLLVLVLKPRFVPRGARRRIRNSILGTDVALAAYVAVGCLALGWQTFLLVQGPVLLVTGAIGIWLFYVQHQFEETYWEKPPNWSYDDAALAGSSYLKLPAVLQFFTGNIGFHHVHHLSAAIPNYNLQQAHEQTTALRNVPELTLWDGLRATRLKLWDEAGNRLVTFAEARRVTP